MMVMLTLCMLLCVVSATAFAATITFRDEDWNEKTVEVSAGTYTLPEYADVGFSLPEGKAFYAWQVIGKEAYLKPGSKIGIKENGNQTIYAKYVETDQTFYEVKYVSKKYNEHEIVGYYPAAPNQLLNMNYPYAYGYGTVIENQNLFLHWEVEGDIEVYDPSKEPDIPDAGWLRLFPRAFADEYVTLTAADEFYVKSDLTITAIWKDSNDDSQGSNGGNPDDNNDSQGGNGGNPGDNNDNQGGNGGNPDDNNDNLGGSGGNPNDVPGGNPTGAGAGKLPKTGDESLPMSFLLTLMAVSLCGIAVLAKRRIN